jgi:DNA-binding response OmpR family regulator
MGRREIIVVVDDHEDTVEVLVEYLRGSGFEAEGFTDPDTALERLTRGLQPRLLLVDYKLGWTLGDEFIRQVRAAGLAMPIAIMTAAHPRHVNTRVLGELGVARVLVKPFPLDEIRCIVAGVARDKEEP